MTTRIIRPLLLPVLVAALSVTAGRATPAFTTIYNFTATSSGAVQENTDGAEPHAGLVLSGGTLFGAAIYGGSYGYGTIFAVNTDGTDFTPLYDFTGGLDGSQPSSSLVLSDGVLYGAAAGGAAGAGQNGALFSINTNGTDFRTLHTFSAGAYNSGVYTNLDGVGPSGALLLLDDTLFGVAAQGGTNGYGTIFSIDISGANFKVLYTFTPTVFSSSVNNFINTDGARPLGALIASGNILFGTAASGGSSSYGTVFALTTSGGGFTTLHNFKYTDGAQPIGGLVLTNSTLFGVTGSGGSGGSGALFAVDVDGGNFHDLYGFAPNRGDAYFPVVGPVLSGNVFYGAAPSGGPAGNGAIYVVSTNGTGYTNLHNFTAYNFDSDTSSFTNGDGALPQDGLILSGNILYGTTRLGGSSGYGTVFGLSVADINFTPPQLAIARSGTNVILTWVTNAITYTLQSNTNIISTNWNTVSPLPVIVNGQNTVTNSIAGTRKFYRLSQ